MAIATATILRETPVMIRETKASSSELDESVESESVRSVIVASEDLQSVDHGPENTNDYSQKPPSPLLPPKMREQFVKTKICPHFARGHCMHGSECTYAHAKEELRPLPDLQKTKLCESVTRGFPCRTYNCTYAHSRDELRATRDLVAYKTSLCFFHKKERCLNGDKCRFAHGVVEIRLKPHNFESLTGCDTRSNSVTRSLFHEAQDASTPIPCESSIRHCGRIDSALATGATNFLSERRFPHIIDQDQHNSARSMLPRREIVPTLPLAEVPYARPHSPVHHLPQQSAPPYHRRTPQQMEGSHHRAATARYSRRGGRDSHKSSPRTKENEENADASQHSCVIVADTKETTSTSISQDKRFQARPPRWFCSANIKEAFYSAHESTHVTTNGDSLEARVEDVLEYEKWNATDAETTDVSGTPTSSSCFDTSPRDTPDSPGSSVETPEIDRTAGATAETECGDPDVPLKPTRAKPETPKNGDGKDKARSLNDSGDLTSEPRSSESRTEHRKAHARRSKFVSNMQSSPNQRFAGINYRRRLGGSHCRNPRDAHFPGGAHSGWNTEMNSISASFCHRSVSYCRPGDGHAVNGPITNCGPQAFHPYSLGSSNSNLRQHGPMFPQRIPHIAPDSVHPNNKSIPLRNARPRAPSNEKKPGRDLPPHFANQRTTAEYPIPGVLSGSGHQRYPQPRVPPRYQMCSPRVAASREQGKSERRARDAPSIVLQEHDYAATSYPRCGGCGPEVGHTSTPITLPEVPIEELTAGQPDHYED